MDALSFPLSTDCCEFPDRTFPGRAVFSYDCATCYYSGSFQYWFSRIMRSDEIAQLLAPFLETPLHEMQLRAVSTHLDLLLRWNQRVNLTAVRQPDEIVQRHFGESFFAARNLFSAEWRGTVVDLGSGGGFPGVPIAIFAHAAKVTLIESNGKKAAFLRELTRTLNVANVDVYAGRAEDWLRAPRPERVNVVTLRAVEKFENAVPLAVSLLRGSIATPEAPPVERRLALLIGSAQVESAKRLVTGFTWQSAVPTPGSHNRVVLIGNLSGQESTR